MAAALCAVFFLSGSAGLVFEILWFHQAGLMLGNSVWASSLVLAGFMGGLAHGNLLAARFGHRVRDPLLAFAVLEATVALTGVGLVYVLPELAPALAPLLRELADVPWALNGVRLLGALALLLVPSTAMGLTLPLLTRALCASGTSFGSALGRLYGFNTLGAVAGVLLAELVLIELLGIRGTALAAGLFNLSAAGAALALRRRIPVSSESTPPAARVRGASAWLTAAALCGFCLLALEVIWFRLLLLYVTATASSFALMLAVVLVGIALGGVGSAVWLRRSPGAPRYAAGLAFGAGALGLASYGAFTRVSSLAAGLGAVGATQVLVIATPLILPVSLLSGALFSFLGAGLRADRDSDSGAAGSLTFANTLGAALGSLAGGFVLLPGCGIEWSIAIVSLFYTGVATILMARTSAPRAVALVPGGAFALAFVFFPFGAMERTHLLMPVQRFAEPSDAIRAWYDEGVAETVIYVESNGLGAQDGAGTATIPVSLTRYSPGRSEHASRHRSLRLITNSSSMSTTRIRARRYMKLYVYWPAALHPDLKRGLLISFGVGSTAKAMTDWPGFESIDVVDTSRAVVKMSELVYPDPGEHPLRDPRVRVHIEDGRHFLQTSDRLFDLITGEPPPPNLAGVVNLYTQEYFELMRRRLAPGGFVTYWLPFHSLSDASAKSILAAFCNVFQDCSLWHGSQWSLMMVGSLGATGPVPQEHFLRQWRDPAVGAELFRLGFEKPEQLGALFIGDAPYLRKLVAGQPPLTDDRPKRVLAPPSSKQALRRLALEWMDAHAAQGRFRESEWIRGLWPQGMREATLPYFEFQDVLQRSTPLRLAGSVPIAELDETLTRSSLQQPILWLLGSDASLQQIAEATSGPERAHPEVQYQLGVGALAARDYGSAAEHLQLAESAPARSAAARTLRGYALCMAQRNGAGPADCASQIR